VKTKIHTSADDRTMRSKLARATGGCESDSDSHRGGVPATNVNSRKFGKWVAGSGEEAGAAFNRELAQQRQVTK